MTTTPSKPRVAINVAMSADGKISTHRRERISLGSAEDRRLMDRLRASHDAVIVGSTTVRLDGWAIRVRDREIRRRRVARGLSPHPLNVVMTTRLDLSPNCQFFSHPRTERLIVTSRQAPAGRVHRWKQYGDVWVTRGRTIRPAAVLAELWRRGCRKVLLEGGGELNFAFFREHLVDEVFITVTPRIFGGREAPTPADGPGFRATTQTRLSLVSSRRRGDEVFLRYLVRR